MKTPSSDIFMLINSMDRSEKRYFKVFARKHVIGEQNNYELLFDLIADQDSYDEQALKKLWALHGDPAHYAVLKQQLFDQILTALHHYHTTRSNNETIKQLLHETEILMNKGLTDAGAKRLKKARKMIDRNEAIELLPEANRLERKQWGEKYYQGVSEESMEQQLQNELADLELLTKMNEQRHVTDKVAFAHYKNVSANTPHPDELLPKGFPKHLYRTELDREQALATWHFMHLQPQKAAVHNKRFIEILEDGGLVEQYPARYFSVLNNYLVDCVSNGKNDEAKAGLKKLRKLGELQAFKRIHDMPVKIFRLGYLLELNLALSEGAFERADELTQQIDAGKKRFEGRIVKHNLFSFDYLLAYLQFGNGNYQACIDRLYSIVIEQDNTAVQEIQRFARTLLIIAQYQAGNYRLLESLLDSVYRYQAKQEGTTLTEKAILSSLRKLNYADERHIKTALFTALQHKLDGIKKKPGETRAYNYFAFHTWIESHLQGQPFKKLYLAEVN